MWVNIYPDLKRTERCVMPLHRPVSANPGRKRMCCM
ncbi:unnamed protein product [Brassica oleracea var. botrytis]